MKKLTLTLAAAGLLSVSTVAHAGNFDGFSLGIEGQLKSTSTSVKYDDGTDSVNAENLGGKHDFIPVISGSYTEAVGPNFLFGIGATYDLGSTDVGSASIVIDSEELAFKVEEKDHYSIFVTLGYLVNDTALLYAKIAHHKMKAELSVDGESESLKFSGVGFGAGVKVALTENVSVYAEAQRVSYSDETLGDFKFEPSSTIGALGFAYKF